MKLCSRKIASGSANMVCATHSGMYVPTKRDCSVPGLLRSGKSVIGPRLQPLLNIVSSGSRDICSGMTCSAKIVKKTKVEPLNGIQAIAYAAMQAMTSGKIAAGIAMAKELKK